MPQTEYSNCASFPCDACGANIGDTSVLLVDILTQDLLYDVGLNPDFQSLMEVLHLANKAISQLINPTVFGSVMINIVKF